jgi:hypothetical protein
MNLTSFQYEALRRVHLIPASSSEPSTPTPVDEEAENENVFKNLDSAVSEGGENFSTGLVNSPGTQLRTRSDVWFCLEKSS